jgi:hypothetical protein
MTTPLRLPRPTPPRGLIFLASAWLVASWVLTLGWRPPVQAHAASYIPGVRMLLLMLAAGLVLAWPLARLSGPQRPWPIRQALLDLVVLLCLVQVVVWPLRLVTRWPIERSAAIDLCLSGWAAAAAAAVVVGTIPARRAGGVLRSGSMVVCVLLFGAMPFLGLVLGAPLPFTTLPGPESPEHWRVVAASPLTGLHALSAGGAVLPSADEWRVAQFPLWVAASLWLAALLIQGIVPRIDDGPDRTTDFEQDRLDDARPMTARAPVQPDRALGAGADDVPRESAFESGSSVDQADGSPPR